MSFFLFFLFTFSLFPRRCSKMPSRSYKMRISLLLLTNSFDCAHKMNRSVIVYRIYCIALNKVLFLLKSIDSFLISRQKKYLLWVLRSASLKRGASNEYPQHTFSSINMKNMMWIPHLICSYVNQKIKRRTWVNSDPTLLKEPFDLSEHFRPK